MSQVPVLTLDTSLWTDGDDYKAHDAYVSANDELRMHADNMHEHGYTIVENSVPESLITEVEARYSKWKADNRDDYEANRKPDGNPPRLVDYHSEEEAVARLFTENRSVEVQDFLFARETSIYTSLFFEVSTQQPIHRDVPVFRTAPENYYFGMWVALEDANETNGALMICRGGHKVSVDQYEIGRRFHSDPFAIPEQDNDMWNAYQNAVVDECVNKGLDFEQVEMKRGQTLIWHPLLPHGGGEIRNPGSTRLSIVFHTVPFGTAVYRQNVFFNEHAENVTPKSRFNYQVLAGGRKTASFGGVKLRDR